MSILLFIPFLSQEEISNACQNRYSIIPHLSNHSIKKWRNGFHRDREDIVYKRDYFYCEKAAIEAEQTWLLDFLDRLPSYFRH